MKYAEVDLRTEYSRWQDRNYWNGRQTQFLAHLMEMVTNPAEARKRLRWCNRCGVPHDMVVDNGVERAYCSQCWDASVVCGHCGERVMDPVMVQGGGMVCVACRDAYYVFCRNCNLYYPHGESRDHLHGADGCCSSPAVEFTIPHRDGILHHDTTVHVAFEGGTLTRTSIRAVVDFLANWAQTLEGGIYIDGTRAYRVYQLVVALNRDPALVGMEAKTREGTFTTRLKRYAYKNHQVKIDPSALTQIGNLIATKTDGREYNIAFTRELNLPPSEFGNPNSCWWTDYRASRCALKSNGGLAMRDLDGERVLGRAWVMPLKIGVDGALAPTFDAHSGIYFTFNGYGTLADEYHRVLAEVVGAEGHINIAFEAERYYVNSGAGKLVGPMDVISKWKGTIVTMPLTEHSDLFNTEQDPTFGSAKTTTKEQDYVEAF